jgi:c-di-GMP-binding flagellar brake protein YcgR
MLERRSSARLSIQTKVREKNGDYLFNFDASDLSEEGMFLVNKIIFNSQDHHSTLSFTLPNGVQLKNITARIVRENRKGEPKGCAYEFLNLSEEARIALKRFLLEKAS